jgi:hypothetical protein
VVYENKDGILANPSLKSTEVDENASFTSSHFLLMHFPDQQIQFSDQQRFFIFCLASPFANYFSLSTHRFSQTAHLLSDLILL